MLDRPKRAEERQSSAIVSISTSISREILSLRVACSRVVIVAVVYVESVEYQKESANCNHNITNGYATLMPPKSLSNSRPYLECVQETIPRPTGRLNIKYVQRTVYLCLKVKNVFLILSRRRRGQYFCCCCCTHKYKELSHRSSRFAAAAAETAGGNEDLL